VNCDSCMRALLACPESAWRHAGGVAHSLPSLHRMRWIQVLLNVYVKPDRPVVSYLTALTGLTAELVEEQGVPLADAVQLLRSCLPPTAILVGQNILQVRFLCRCCR
jgi:DNA polymerase III epsilon subunit-like protein